MTCRCLPADEPIELINVAFQRNKSTSTSDPPITKGWSKPKKDRPRRAEHDKFQPEDSASTPASDPTQLPSMARIPTEYDTPDRLSGYEALEELRMSCPGREWRFVEVNVTYEVSQPYLSK